MGSMVSDRQCRKNRWSLPRICAVFLSTVLLLTAVAWPLGAVFAARGNENLLAGKQPIQAYVSGGGYNLATKAADMSWYADGKSGKPTVQQLAGLTNGVEGTAKENSLYFSNDYYGQKRAVILVYDLGEERLLSEIRVIGEAGNVRLGEVRLYAGNTFDSSSNDGRKDLFDAAHRVDTFGTDGVDSDTGVAQQTFDGVSARYVAFVIMQGVAVETARANQAWVRELAVFGSVDDTLAPVTCTVVDENGAAVTDACTTTLPEETEIGKDLSFTVTPGSNFQLVSVAVNGQTCTAEDGRYTVPQVSGALEVVITVRRRFNLIYRMLPMDFYAVNRRDYSQKASLILKVEDNDFTAIDAMTADLRASLLRLTDGNTNGSIDDRCMLYAYDKNAKMVDKPCMVLVYDMGYVADVEQIYFASTGENGYYVAGYDFFISETLEELLDEKSKVYTSNGNTVGDDGELDGTFDLTQREHTVSVEARGRYAAVVITRPLPVSKLAAAGYKARAVEFSVYGYVQGTFPVTATVVDETGTPVENACSLDLPAFVPDGNDFSFRLLPKVGYRVVSVTANGAAVTEENGEYTVGPVTKAQELVITLESVTTYPITLTVVDTEGNPTANACTADLPALVEENDELVFCPQPMPGYAIASVTANGQALQAANGVYTIKGIAQEQAIRITVERIVNLIEGQPLTKYYAVNRNDYQTPLYMTSFSAGDSELALTDGSLEPDSRLRIQTSGNPVGGYVTAGSKNIVLIYYLGGIADVKSIYFASTNEKGYYVAGYDYFVSESLEDLLNTENLVWSSGGNQTLPEDEETLDPSTSIMEREKTVYFPEAKRGRYAAIVITRPHSTTSLGYNMARISEIGVYGTMIEEDVLPNMQFIDDRSGVSVVFSAPSADVALKFGQIGIETMRVEFLPVSDVTISVLKREHCEAASQLLRVRFYNAAGEMLPETAFEAYTCQLSMPVQGTEFRFWYAVQEDIPLLVNNSTLKDGAVTGVTDTIYQDFVAARFLNVNTLTDSGETQLPVGEETKTKPDNNSPETGEVLAGLLWSAAACVLALAVLRSRIRRRRVRF